MFRSRNELISDLYHLHVALPQWRKALPSDADFVSQCQTLSDRLLASAGDEDREWLRSRLGNLSSRQTGPAPELS